MKTFLNKVEIGVNSDVVWFSRIPDGIMNREIVIDRLGCSDNMLDILVQGDQKKLEVHEFLLDSY